MAISLPLPVRIAAGLVVTGWDTLRNLPSELPALTVSVAGYAVRLSMRVQQEITELAGRGDELLSALTSRPSEHPTWAHFDEEDDGSPLTAASAEVAAEAPPDRDLARFDDAELDVDVAWVAVGGEAFNDDVEILAEAEEWLLAAAEVADLGEIADLDETAELAETPDLGGAGDTAQLGYTADTAEPGSIADRWGGADQPDGPPRPPQLRLAPTDPDPEHPTDPAPSIPRLSVVPDDSQAGQRDRPSAVSSFGSPPWADGGAPSGAGDGPAALPGYDRMTLAQVRGRLRGLSPDSVSALLSYEQAGPARAPFLTLLTNRMSTLEHEAR